VAPLLADLLESHAGPPAPATAGVPTPPASVPLPVPFTRDEAVVPLGYEHARILVHATPEAMRQVEDGTVHVDRATVRWLERWVKIGDVVYDLGAGIGSYVLIAARQRGAVVVAFEAGYKAYAAMCDNILLNGCQGAVIPVSLALGPDDAVASIKYERRHPGAARHTLQSGRWRVRPADAVQANVHPVCAMRLDTAVSVYGLPPANHLRLSSWTSAEALDGARRTLAQATLRSVWLQVSPDAEAAAVDTLAASGLRVARRRVRRTLVQLVLSRDAAGPVAAAEDGREEMPAR
jgi:FkbM family methyltransferase